jgi:hypothetical protein
MILEDEIGISQGNQGQKDRENPSHPRDESQKAAEDVQEPT